jgi:undecaprenyl-diphosphatase
MVSRKLGTLAVVLAAAEGFTAVYTGSHYPTDVMGGFALGAATTLLLAPPALAVLTAAAEALARSRWAVLVRVPVPAPVRAGATAGRARPHGPRPAAPRHSAADKDLAA